MALTLSVKNDLKRQLPKLLLAESKKRMRKSFQAVKNEMLMEFLNHPVTLEIKGGVNASNISGTLSGITNLYSFIGFPAGENPTEIIYQELQKTTMTFSNISGTKIIFSLNMPSSSDIFALTPLPYQPGRSWAKSIETGLSGLGYYLNKSSRRSRSGLGIQAKAPIRSVKFKNTKYISFLLNTYRKKFENITI